MTTSRPMPGDCARFAERLAALAVDGDAELKPHLAACADCRREVERYRGLAERLRRDEEAANARADSHGAARADSHGAAAALRDGMPADLHDGILRAIEAAARAPSPSPPRHPWRAFGFAAGAAAALAAAALGWMLLVHRAPRPIARHKAPPAVETPFEDEDDPCQLIGDLDADELARVRDYFKKGA